MVLRNYWIAFSNLVCKYDDSIGNKTSSEYLYTIVGGTYQILIGGNNDSQKADTFKNAQLKTRNISFRFGSGTTAPSYTDYALETDITDSSISNISFTTDSSASSEGAKTTYIITGVNSTNSSITISEIGLCKNFYTLYNNLLSVPFMLVKEVLDTPITVAARDSFTLTFEWVEG